MRPVRTYGSDDAGVENCSGTSPAISAINPGPEPLYGIISILTPAISLNSSAAICGVPLTPGDAAASAPGRALASAITSLTVRAGTEGCTTSTFADSTICDT